ncbi:hypothetical protein GWI33_013651 [Rhynchophorus ferrugineus]|uniref:Uncharacterized protein n=1 Tax=Rhynchophorus ferrugineus TaxID=354439 RepID=A0A834I7P9_RHYFE|nr:hypothetical protein GWI33_013651 [Rhynchophorus ferrugineus]
MFDFRIYRKPKGPKSTERRPGRHKHLDDVVGHSAGRKTPVNAPPLCIHIIGRRTSQDRSSWDLCPMERFKDMSTARNVFVTRPRMDGDGRPDNVDDFTTTMD